MIWCLSIYVRCIVLHEFIWLYSLILIPVLPLPLPLDLPLAESVRVLVCSDGEALPSREAYKTREFRMDARSNLA
jgi:hypothetical protein